MTNEELFEWCSKQKCKPGSNCDLCMYNKGINDFVKEMRKYWGGLKAMEEIERVAEQLKGNSNER